MTTHNNPHLAYLLRLAQLLEAAVEHSARPTLDCLFDERVDCVAFRLREVAANMDGLLDALGDATRARVESATRNDEVDAEVELFREMRRHIMQLSRDLVASHRASAKLTRRCARLAKEVVKARAQKSDDAKCGATGGA